MVELSGTAVGARVLVAETRRDLEVFVEAGDHQQLLEHLRRLGQRVEGTRMDARGHQIVACALGRACGENRRLELVEALLDHPRADRGDDLRAQQDIALHGLASEVEKAVAQARFLAGVGLGGHLQGQDFGRALDLEGGDAYLDLAGRQLVVDGFRTSLDDPAGDGNDALDPRILHCLEQIAADVDDALGKPVMIAQIEEQQVAVVALGMDPARQPDLRAGMLVAEFPASVRAVRVHGPVYGHNGSFDLLVGG